MVITIVNFSKLDLESSKLFLHEPFCIRNNKLCDKCGKIVEIGDYDEHLKEHKVESKPQINEVKPNSYVPVSQIVKQPKLIKQKSEQRNCEFCNLQLHLEEYTDHISLCGARSTSCEYCNKALLTKDLNKHYELCDILLMSHLQEEEYMRGMVN